MKRKVLLTILFVLLASVMVAMPTMAASDSVVGTPDAVVEWVNGSGVLTQYFFANGTPITVTARTDGEEGCTVTWDGGSVNLIAKSYIFGGMHDNATPVSTSVTVNGGKMYMVSGAGLHESTTTISNVVVNGGTITSLCGGGITTLMTCNSVAGSTCDSYGWTPTAETQEAYKLSNNQTKTANVTLNGGTVNLVYGGGGSGNTNTETVNLTISGGTHEWVTGGSSNGNTTTVNTVIAGGTVTDYQSVNRGTATEAKTEVTGGTVTKLSVVSNAANTVSLGDATVVIGESATVTELTYGYNNGVEVDTTTGNITSADVVISNDATVGNKESLGDNFVTVYTVGVIADENGNVVADKDTAVAGEKVSFTVVPEEGYELDTLYVDGLHSEGDVVDNSFTMPANNVTIKATFKALPVQEPEGDGEEDDNVTPPTGDGSEGTKEEVKEDVKDESPKTGAKSLVAFFVVVAVLGMAVSKKERGF